VAEPISPINKALNLVPRRAEAQHAEQLRDTFVDSGISVALESVDHQVLYGRRGTGKTHALRYLESEIRGRGHIVFYADLRTVGSPEGLFGDDPVPITERAARLLVDLLSQLHDALVEAAVEDDDLITEPGFDERMDDLAAAISTVRVAGAVEVEEEGERTRAESTRAGGSLRLGPQPAVSFDAGEDASAAERQRTRERRSGEERIRLNFTDVARALRQLVEVMGARRVWLLLDEWSSVPAEIQPYLAEFLVRCVLPLRLFTVKVAAIEQQTRFRVEEGGRAIGFELGADIAANVDLDEFMVFEQNEERAREFFRGLLFKHLTRGVEDDNQVPELTRENDVIRIGFTERRAFDELVRAAEGVPRDAINIAAKAAMLARDRKISVPDIRAAARAWYQNDKAAALSSRAEALQLLNWVIDKVIKQKRARGFLVNQRSARAPLLMTLFDARVLHLARKGYSGQDEPGERYDVYVIDYGAYVDLINTVNEPQGTLPIDADADADAGADGGYVEVPPQDLRAIRRAILDLDEFAAASSGSP
jgi:hypothetical protein